MDINQACEAFRKLLEEQQVRVANMCTEKTDFATKPVVTIGVIDGDGIGPIITKQASRVLEKLPQLEEMPKDGGVAKLYRLPGAKGNIGLISPLNAHFCGECNRLRLTADGKLKPCLHSDAEYSIKGLSRADMKAVMEKAIWEKPAWHGQLDALNRSRAGRNMNQIGG